MRDDLSYEYDRGDEDKMSNYHGFEYEEFNEKYPEDCEFYSNSLNLLFEKQMKLQNKLNTDVHSIQYFKDMTLAQIDEITESLRETPWKPWKKQQTLNKEKLKEELIDELHFFINRCLYADLMPDELIYRFVKKNKENIKRNEEGY